MTNAGKRLAWIPVVTVQLMKDPPFSMVFNENMAERTIVKKLCIYFDIVRGHKTIEALNAYIGDQMEFSLTRHHISINNRSKK